MLEKVKERLLSFGYTPKEEDESALVFSAQKVEKTVKNECNVPAIPDGLIHIAVDMCVGEFLKMKKTFAPDGLEGLDLGSAVKELKEGDVTLSFVSGEGSLTAEQRLDAFIHYLLVYGKEEFSAYRRLRW